MLLRNGNNRGHLLRLRYRPPTIHKTIHFGYGGVDARGVETFTNFLRFRYHHMTIHEDAWNALMDTRKDWSTCMVEG